MISDTQKGLLSRSKIIKKPKSGPSPTKSSSSSKTYRTYQDSTKKNMQGDLVKGCIQYLVNKYSGSRAEDFLTQDLNDLIDQLPLKIYNNLLRTVIQKHDSTFVDSRKALTEWRKKIKNWNKKVEKPETRGSPVVPPHKLDLFREKAFKILQNLPYRSFPLLQSQFLTILEEFHNEEQQASGEDYKPFDPNTCSKHWFHNFMKKNPDIKEIWEDIPLERTCKAGKAPYRTPLQEDINSPADSVSGFSSLSENEQSKPNEEDVYQDPTTAGGSPNTLFEGCSLLLQEFDEQVEVPAASSLNTLSESCSLIPQEFYEQLEMTSGRIMEEDVFAGSDVEFETQRLRQLFRRMKMDQQERELLSEETVNAFSSLL